MDPNIIPYKQIIRGLVFALITVFAVSPASSTEIASETSDLMEESLVLVQHQSVVKKKKKVSVNDSSVPSPEVLTEPYHEPYQKNAVSVKLYLLHRSFKLFD